MSEDEVKSLLELARRRKKDAERTLLNAAKELAEAVKAFDEAETAFNNERRSAPLRPWTKASSVADRFQYVRFGYALVREISSVDSKRPWRIQKGKGYLMDRFGRVLCYTSAETAAVAANELIDSARIPSK